jgi:hypothetical protein
MPRKPKEVAKEAEAPKKGKPGEKGAEAWLARAADKAAKHGNAGECNQFKTTGSCTRGDSCRFSHGTAIGYQHMLSCDCLCLPVSFSPNMPEFFLQIRILPTRCSLDSARKNCA